jgi:hypothetical protein
MIAISKLRAMKTVLEAQGVEVATRVANEIPDTASASAQED